jgi:hypothetical protein
MDSRPPGPVDLLPDPRVIRARLSELASEADLLRALLRLMEQRVCGREVMRRRQRRQEVARA